MTATMAGLDVPVQHVRRNIYSTAAGATPTHPMTIDVATGVFLRSEGERLLFGLSRLDEAFGYNTSVDWEWMETVLERAESRFPWLLDAPLDQSGAWAGTYEVTPDNFPVLGRLPEAQDWVNACGFSGHGVMQGPMAGLLVAEEVLDGGAHSVDIDPLRIDRLRSGDMRVDAMVL
jgi:sarcosine oxidase subunit beta